MVEYCERRGNRRSVKEPVPVLDLDTNKTTPYAGWNAGGRTYILTREGVELPELIACVNIGPSKAAYVLRSQLDQDPGLYNYMRRFEKSMV